LIGRGLNNRDFCVGGGGYNSLYPVNHAELMITVCGKSAGICKGVAGGGNTALCTIEVKLSVGSAKNHSISAQ